MESSDAGAGGGDDDEEGAASSSQAALNAFEEIQPLDDLSLIRCCIFLPACVGAWSGPGTVMVVVVGVVEGSSLPVLYS